MNNKETNDNKISIKNKFRVFKNTLKTSKIAINITKDYISYRKVMKKTRRQTNQYMILSLIVVTMIGILCHFDYRSIFYGALAHITFATFMSNAYVSIALNKYRGEEN